MSADQLKPPGSQDGVSPARELDPTELTALWGKMVRFASMQLGDQQLVAAVPAGTICAHSL